VAGQGKPGAWDHRVSLHAAVLINYRLPTKGRLMIQESLRCRACNQQSHLDDSTLCLPCFDQVLRLERDLNRWGELDALFEIACKDDVDLVEFQARYQKHYRRWEGSTAC
jgi:hypothetical protein